MKFVADIGGTNARFAIAERQNGAIVIRDPQSFLAADFPSIGEATEAYLTSVGQRPVQACFAVAAPIEGDEIAFTNSPWNFGKAAIQRHLGLSTFHVINDFEALAAGIALVPEGFFSEIRPGQSDSNAPKLVIGPGTGLGQALIVPCGGANKVIATQGGHVSFAPQSPLEIDVMRFLAKERPRVSVERLLCGQGLVNIYRALLHIAGKPPQSLQPHEVTAAAIAGDNAAAVQAVTFFCNLFGAVAGDAALSSGTRGGVYVAGGILPKIKDIFLASDYEAQFLNKGRMRSYLEPIPITLVEKDGAALYGAAGILLSSIVG